MLSRTLIDTEPSTEAPQPGQRLYVPKGAAKVLLESRDEELVLDGPAGTGKSRAALEKLYLAAAKYPNMRGLICRKVQRTIRQSAQVTWETKVLPLGSPVSFHGGNYEYRFPNGSVVALGGMDKASKIMSTEWDMIYVMEATELLEDDWENLTTRLRNWTMPYQQIIGDVNPGPPTHWLKQRANRGSLRMVQSKHEDNPELWDSVRHDWTPKGRVYIDKLDRLTGVRKLRLRYGQWAAAEGMVYDTWDRERNLIPSFSIPRLWRRWLAIDFGYTHPFVCQWWAEDPDGRLYLYREFYGTQTLVEDWARLIVKYSRYETIAGLITDHDAEGRATLEKYLGLQTIPADKRVLEGIQAVQSRMRPADDGKPRLFILEGTLTLRDPLLDDAKLPASTVEEIDGYVWKRHPDGRFLRDEPVKDNDHGMDAMRYMVMHLDGAGVDVEAEVAAALSAFNRYGA